MISLHGFRSGYYSSFGCYFFVLRYNWSLLKNSMTQSVEEVIGQAEAVLSWTFRDRNATGICAHVLLMRVRDLLAMSPEESQKLDGIKLRLEELLQGIPDTNLRG